jgi:hypothetical protein
LLLSLFDEFISLGDNNSQAKCTDLELAMNIVLDLADSPASSVAIKRQRITLSDKTNTTTS